MDFPSKHSIKKTVGPDGKVRWYGCRRSVSYKESNLCSWSGGIGVPLCDLANLAGVGQVRGITTEVLQLSNELK